MGIRDLPPSWIQVTPKKGQMLAVSLPESLPLRLVVRTPSVYIVPRTSGPNAGRAIIGATIEDAGFDKTFHPSDISRLQSLAARLLPQLANADQLEAWAGLRPATPDGLPLLGALAANRNHLLPPATSATASCLRPLQRVSWRNSSSVKPRPSTSLPFLPLAK